MDQRQRQRAELRARIEAEQATRTSSDDRDDFAEELDRRLSASFDEWRVQVASERRQRRDVYDHRISEERSSQRAEIERRAADLAYREFRERIEGRRASLVVNVRGVGGSGARNADRSAERRRERSQGRRLYRKQWAATSEVVAIFREAS